MPPDAAPFLVLASASPRRRELLAALGLPFAVRPLDVDETPPPGRTAVEAVRVIALRKAEAAATKVAEPLVLVADTIVVLDGRVLGKPRDAADAMTMLRALSGRAHEVYTAVVAVDAASGRRAIAAPCTSVLVRPLADGEIAGSIAAGTPFDKAGAYAIQDEQLQPVERSVGCYCNVMGLPLWTARGLLAALRANLALQPPDTTYARCAACPLRPSG
jgi:septum formation protein